MRLVVTGRSGQIVRALQALDGGSLTVVPLARPVLDLTRPQTIAAAVAATRPDALINAAAMTQVDDAERDPAAAAQINGVSAGLLASAAADLHIPIVQISTDQVFDGSSATPYRECDSIAPINAYGRSKAAGEAEVRTRNANHAILRTSWVYDDNGRNFLTTMLRLAHNHSTVDVVCDQIGAPCFASDLAVAIAAVARNLCDDRAGKGVGLFHMTHAGATSRAEFARRIFAYARTAGLAAADIREIRTDDYPMLAARPLNCRLDCTRVAAVHGIRLPDWRDGLERCMRKLLAGGTAS